MSDIISAASLIFTIIALTFNSQVKEINYIIEEKEYDRTSPESRKTQKNIVVRAILLKAFPLFLAFWILFYTLLPKAITLIKESSISLWHFDTVNTLFIFIEAIILLFAIRSFYMLLKLFNKVTKLK